MITRICIILGCFILICSCSEPQARKPLSQSSHSSIKASITRNKKLVAAEEQELKKAIARDSIKDIIQTGEGYWYYKLNTDTTKVYTPKKGDEIIFSYQVVSLNNSVIIPFKENGKIPYKVDQTHQELIPGIRRGIKLLHEGETGVFYLPSHLAYGYYGIPDKLGSNYPLKTIVTLHQILKTNTN